MKKKLTLTLIFLLISQLMAEIKLLPPESGNSHSFAIVIDGVSYQKTTAAVEAYRDAIEKDGLSCYIMVENSATPDEIKSKIIELYNKEKFFEGIALVGDVPVPMIRDAQHLASAFKMDVERFKNFQRSSIASDRFYEDFDLSFKFLHQDTSNTKLFYYSLCADGDQVIRKEIYSGRIKPPVDSNEKYQLLEEYLTRIAEQKARVQEIHNMLTFAGHGYHSESLASWEWDLLTMREQFPQLYQAGNQIKNLNHASSDHMKKIILTEIQNPKLDVALFHAHGSDDTQYLNGYPIARNVNDNIRDIKLYVRGKLRQAKRWKRDPEDYKKRYMERYGIPEEWFEGAFDDSMMTVDSIYGADLDIYASDLKGIKTQPKFVMFDECYNGQFFHTPYIAGAYLFSGGNTIATVANSVNVKQDIWANEFIGLLNQGVRVGEWHKTRSFLESHLLGDPTFHFYSVPEKLVKALYSDKSEKYWKEMLEDENPVYRGLAVRKLFEERRDIDELVKIYNSDESFLVRMQALKCLSYTRSKEFEILLGTSAYDPAEMIRRITANWMGKIGREDYIPILADLMFNDHSERVSRTAKDAIGVINPGKAITVVEQTLTKMADTAEPELLREPTIRSLKRNVDWVNKEIINTLESDTTVKAKKGELRTLRNYSFHQAIDEVCGFMLNEKEDLSARIIAAEALGWFTFSTQKDEIVEACNQIITQKDVNEKLKNEAIKTIKRIKQGSNDPVTP